MDTGKKTTSGFLEVPRNEVFCEWYFDSTGEKVSLTRSQNRPT